MKSGPTRSGAATGIDPGRRNLLIRMSALLGSYLLPTFGTRGVNANDTSAEPTGAPDAEAQVTFRGVATAVRLDSRFAGLSYEKTKLTVPMFSGSNANLIRLFNLLGGTVLRIGANAVDRSSWNGAVEGLAPILPAHVDALAEFVQATQCHVVYGVNLARNTPARAAEEASYVAQRLGPSLLAWETGNEPDLYLRHGYRPDGWSYSDYLREWRDFHAAISKAVPSVAFSGPGTAFHLEKNTLLFARDERHRLGMLTHHYYRADWDDPNSTLALLLRPHAGLRDELASLVRAASNEDIPLGVRLTEANSFHGGGAPGASNAFGSALWVIDFLFTCALAGCRGVNMHGGNRGSYTPIADRDGEVVEARPLFYGMVLFAQGGSGIADAGGGGFRDRCEHQRMGHTAGRRRDERRATQQERASRRQRKYRYRERC